MDRLHQFGVGFRCSLSRSSTWPPIMPSTVPGGVGNQADDLHGCRGRRIQSGEDFVGARLQGVPGQNRDGLAKRHVAGGLAAAQVVVVQRGKIVVDQRVGVQHLDGRAQPLDAAGQLCPRW